MKKNRSYEVFLETIKAKFPEKKMLVALLMNILFIEKEAIYRRLRGEVPFTFAEITAIAKNLNISLDNIIGMQMDSNRIRPCRMTLIDFLNPSETDYAMLEAFIYDIQRLKITRDSEAGTATNIIPQLFHVNYDRIYRFYLFKWLYQFGDVYTKVPYKEIRPSERLMEINQEFQRGLRYAENMYVIWDKNTFQFLVDDILYFNDIQLISDEDRAELKEELIVFLNDLEKLTLDSCFETGKRIHFYVSHISIATTQVYISIDDDFKLSMLKWFTLTDTVSSDEKTFERMKKWMLALQRSSTLISESGEIQRIRFFETQRRIIDLL